MDNSTATMGKVLATVSIVNRADQILLNRGVISPPELRSVILKNVLIDTGATTLCLPPEIIAQLGLELLKEVDVSTATGVSKARIFQDAKISVCG